MREREGRRGIKGERRGVREEEEVEGRWWRKGCKDGTGHRTKENEMGKKGGGGGIGMEQEMLVEMRWVSLYKDKDRKKERGDRET